MASSVSASPLRQVWDERLSGLLRDVEALVEARVASASAEAFDRSRRETAGSLNQAARRIRQAEGASELRAVLLDATAGFAAGAALLMVEAGAAAVEGVRGISGEESDSLRAARIPLSGAAALAGAIETRDPVVALVSPAELSESVASLLEERSGGRVSLFPVVTADGRAPALVLAWGDVDAAALELLAGIAGAAWRLPEPPPAPTLVTIAAAPAAPASGGSAWERLAPVEQQVHLRAQRFARVQVAEMRLSHAGEVRAGRVRRDLYGELRRPIDGAREVFRDRFFSCPSMVDYLHLELAHTLANDDSELLGKDYPGPIV